VRHTQRRAGSELVVLDQVEPVPLSLEHRRAVVVGRRRPLAVVELGLAGAGDHAVAEARRQGQQTGWVVHQRRERAV
jgi:hypothetical protein